MKTDITKNLYFRESGNGPALIILHGLLGTGTNWNRFSKALGDAFHIFALDLRNHGRSFHDPEMNYRVMADDIVRFMDQQGLSEARILGHSMGGKAGMELALTYPERLSSLIVVDIAPVTYPDSHGDILRAMSSLELDAIKSRADADRLLKVDDDQLRGFILTNLSRDDDGYKWRINLDALVSGLTEILSFPQHEQSYKGKVRFIAGERSHYIDDAYLPEIKRLFPGSDLVTIPGSGHWPHIDAAEQLESIAREFLCAG